MFQTFVVSWFIPSNEKEKIWLEGGYFDDFSKEWNKKQSLRGGTTRADRYKGRLVFLNFPIIGRKYLGNCFSFTPVSGVMSHTCNWFLGPPCRIWEAKNPRNHRIHRNNLWMQMFHWHNKTTSTSPQVEQLAPEKWWLERRSFPFWEDQV